MNDWNYTENSQTLDVFYGNGRPTVRYGICASGGRPSAGPFILAYSSEWLREGALRLEGVGPGWLCKDLLEAEDRVREILNSDAPGYVEMLGGEAFVVFESETEFSIAVDSSHEKFTRLPAGTTESIALDVQYLALDEESLRESSWRAGKRLKLFLRLRGAVGDFSRSFALDVGTTNTCACFMGADEEPRLYRFAGSRTCIPSTVHYADALSTPRRYEIGQAEELTRLSHDPRSVIRSFKRRLCAGFRREAEEVVDANGELVSIGIEDVYQDFVAEVLRDFQETQSAKLRKVKATYPPGFDRGARGIMKTAYHRLGLEDDEDLLFGIDEASAAALYYVWRRLRDVGYDLGQYVDLHGEEHNTLVLDVGGGTTDIALVCSRVSPANAGATQELLFDVLGSTTVEHVGGDDFTLELLKSIKVRIALICAERYRDGQHRPSGESARRALEELGAGLCEFRAQLDEGAIVSRDARRHLDLLADEVIPTAWKRSKGALERHRALKRFYFLWSIAEQAKIALCGDAGDEATGEFRPGAHRFQDEVFQTFQLKACDWEELRLVRTIDLEPRIRWLLSQAVRSCRQVMSSPSGSELRVDSIKLVGNSCRIPLVRELVLDEFSSHPLLHKRIEFDPDGAKASVAIGACLAFHLNHFQGSRRLRIRCTGLDSKRLGFWIGDAELGGFDAYFDPWATVQAGSSLRDRPFFDLADIGQTQIHLWRKAVGDEAPAQRWGKIDLSSCEERDVPDHFPAAPPGQIRLLLVDRGVVIAQRDRTYYRMKVRRVSVNPRYDPFSGEH